MSVILFDLAYGILGFKEVLFEFLFAFRSLPILKYVLAYGVKYRAKFTSSRKLPSCSITIF